MSDLEALAAYHVNEHTPLIKREITAREAADPSGLSERWLPTEAELTERRIRALEARIAALERRLNESDGGK